MPDHNPSDVSNAAGTNGSKVRWVRAAPDEISKTQLPKMLSVQDVAEIFGRAPRTVRSWIQKGLLQPVKIGHSVFIPDAQVKALVASPAQDDPTSHEAN